MSTFLSELKCTRCGKKYSPERYVTTCPECEGIPGGILEAVYSFDKIRDHVNPEELRRRIPGVWKYFEFLPASERSNIISLGEGGTTLHKSERLARKIGLRNLYLKDETSNPTGAFIDRGTTVEITRIRELGRRSVYCGLSGNLAASLVAYAARAGLKCKAFLPLKVDVGKFYQTIAYGADVEIAKDIDDAFQKAYRASVQEHRSSHFVMPYNLYFMEGEKTTAYEICEQLDWTVPDQIFVPMGSGGHLSMMWKGISELYKIGFLKDKTVKVVGTQAQGCAPIVQAVQRKGQRVVPQKKKPTIAVDICMENPSCGVLALEAIKESKGTATSVSDKEIIDAVSLLAKLEGIFVEPAAATTIAGLKKLVEEGEIDPSEKIVCVLTGMGLKYPEVTKNLIKGSKKLEELLRRIERRKYTTALGETKMQILKIMSERESYGYEVWKVLRDELGVKMQIPSIYQHLAELERSGLLMRSRTERTLKKTVRSYYKLTEKGKAVLTQLKKMSA